MKDENKSLFVGVDTVQRDLGVSRAKAYEVIRELNHQLKEQYRCCRKGQSKMVRRSTYIFIKRIEPP